MREIEKYRIVISDEHEGVARIIDTRDESQYLEVPIINQRISGDVWIEFRPAQFNIIKKKSEVVQFEEALDITDEQRIALYEYWGNSRAIIVKDTTIKLGISNIKAKELLQLAFKLNILGRGHNCTWRVLDNTIQERWKEEAVSLRKGEGRDIPKLSLQDTVQNALTNINNRGTEEQKRIARGEGSSSIEVVPSGTSGVSRVSKVSKVETEDEMYSGAKEAKKKEKEQWEKNNQLEKEKAIKAMNDSGKGIPSVSVRKVLPPIKKK